MLDFFLDWFLLLMPYGGILLPPTCKINCVKIVSTCNIFMLTGDVFMLTCNIVIEQWGIFNVPHLLWYGPTLYNGHLRAERLAVELSLPVLTTCPDRGSNPYLPHARRTLFLYATAAVELMESWLILERDYNKTTVITLWCCPYFSADFQKNI